MNNCLECGNPGFAPHAANCPNYSPDVHRVDGSLPESKGDTVSTVDVVAEAILKADADFWEEEPHFNLALARIYAQAAIDALQLTPFWAVAYVDGGQSEECWERREQAEEALTDYNDAVGNDEDAYLVTASFTGWVRVEGSDRD